MSHECDRVDCLEECDVELELEPVESVKPFKTYTCDTLHFTEGVTHCPLMAQTMKAYDDASFGKAPKCSSSCHSCRTMHLVSKSLHNSRLVYSTTPSSEAHNVQFELQTQHADTVLRLQLGEVASYVDDALYTVALYAESTADVPFEPSDATLTVLDAVLSRVQSVSSDYVKVDAIIAKEAGFIGVTGKRQRVNRGTTYDEAQVKVPTRKKQTASLTEPHKPVLKPVEEHETVLQPVETHETVLKPVEEHETVLTPRSHPVEWLAASQAAQVHAREELDRTTQTKTHAQGSAPRESYPALQAQPKPTPVPAAVAATELREKAKVAKAKQLAADTSKDADVVFVRETVRRGRAFRGEFPASDGSAPRGYSARDIAADTARADAQRKVWVKKEPSQ